MSLKVLLAALIGWMVISVAILVLVGGVVNTPGCARLVSPTPECQAAMAAANDAIFRTRTLPILIAIAVPSGIIAVAIALRIRGSLRR